MKLDDKTLEEVERWAAYQFDPEDIAIALCLDPAAFTAEVAKHPRGPLALAIRRGQLKAEAEVRMSVLKLAKGGSTPAQKQYLEMVKRRKGESSKDPDPFDFNA